MMGLEKFRGEREAGDQRWRPDGKLFRPHLGISVLFHEHQVEVPWLLFKTF